MYNIKMSYNQQNIYKIKVYKYYMKLKKKQLSKYLIIQNF